MKAGASGCQEFASGYRDLDYGHRFLDNVAAVLTDSSVFPKLAATRVFTGDLLHFMD
jgi:hypothetical protein